MKREIDGQESMIPVQELGEAIIKKRDGRDGRNLPTVDHLAGTGVNSQYLAFILAKDNLPKIDLSEPEQIRERVNWYFNFCMEHDMKPTVNGLASAIGVTRMALWNWKNGIKRPQNYEIIADAYSRLEELWEMYMMNGKINPACGIFLAKNHFDYKDVQDVVVTPNNPLDETRSAEEIAEQYEFLPEE